MVTLPNAPHCDRGEKSSPSKGTTIFEYTTVLHLSGRDANTDAIPAQNEGTKVPWYAYGDMSMVGGMSLTTEREGEDTQ